MYEIDNINLKIINILLEDGRTSASEIARQIGDISVRAIRYRIERLIEERVIHISAIVNPKSLGLDTIADVWMEVESDKIAEVANRLAEYENVTYVACSIGATDVSIQVVGCDTGEIYRFVTEEVRKMPGVRKTVTSIVPVVLKDVYQWRVPKKCI